MIYKILVEFGFEIRNQQEGKYFRPIGYTHSLYLDIKDEVDFYEYIDDEDGERRGDIVYKGAIDGLEQAIRNYFNKINPTFGL